jgi:hypothetical protein
LVGKRGVVSTHNYLDRSFRKSLWRAGCSETSVQIVSAGPLDLSLPFLPEALAGLATVKALDENGDRRRMNQIRACSYLHLFDMFEACLADAARRHATRDVDTRDLLAPLLRLDAFDHSDLFHAFERVFATSFPIAPQHVARPTDLDDVLSDAAPLSLLVFALHLKLVTQQHYLACVRGDETLEPSFVRVLKEHWTVECGQRSSSAGTPAGTDGHGPAGDTKDPPPGSSPRKPTSPSLAIQQALAAALPGRVPAALRDYRRIVFTSDDVLRRQSELDVATLEAARGVALSGSDRDAVLLAQVVAHRKTFITFGIVNAAFVYAMSSLGPSAPAMLAGVVSALSAR